jgi:hypothetical protein
MPASASPRPIVPLHIINVAPDSDGPKGYVPGVCNIGPWEIRRRWAGGIAGLVLAGAVLALLIVIGAPAIARLLVLLPLWGGLFSVLQARRRFCGAYAMRRISNFGDDLTTVRDVADAAAHRADMAAVARLTRDSFVIGLAIAIVAVLLPL